MFLDTSGIFAIHHQKEKNHEEALALFEAVGPKFTHNLVLAELIPLALVPGARRNETLSFVRVLLNHPEIEVCWVNEALHRSALTLLEARSDKDYSLCDAVSFVLMDLRGVAEALTTDQHFQQAGFLRLLQPL